jgi:hypothetical protein
MSRASEGFTMTTEHSVLASIRAAIGASGTHSQHWGALRREVFAGEASWAGLKAWCAENGFECDLAFTQASKSAEVIFRRAK